VATLQRLIASHVLAALGSREHLRVAADSHDALTDELEIAVAPMLPSITPYLMAVPGMTALDGFGNSNADEAVAVMIDVIGDRLAHSNHIDDIFADDARIRRDALRATRELLLSYMQGELVIEDDHSSDSAYVVQLDQLGYVVAAAARRAPRALLRGALNKAARQGDAELESYDPQTRIAIFRPTRERAGLLAIEEAIAREIGRLVEASRIELPSIAQLFELSPEVAAHERLAAALAMATRAAQNKLRCIASCTRVSTNEVRVSFTPLSAEVAQDAERHFDELLTAIETALGQLGYPFTAAPDSEERSVARGKGKTASAPTSSRRQPRARARPAKTRTAAKH
jgi:hypothetical protein